MSDNLASFAQLLSALGQAKGGHANVGAIMPEDDASDLSRGAKMIPGAVTDARRAGKKCTLVQDGAHWFWQMPDGTTIDCKH